MRKHFRQDFANSENLTYPAGLQWEAGVKDKFLDGFLRLTLAHLLSTFNMADMNHGWTSRVFDDATGDEFEFRFIKTKEKGVLIENPFNDIKPRINEQ